MQALRAEMLTHIQDQVRQGLTASRLQVEQRIVAETFAIDRTLSGKFGDIEERINSVCAATVSKFDTARASMNAIIDGMKDDVALMKSQMESVSEGKLGEVANQLMQLELREKA